MKYLKLGIYEIAALAIIACAASLRILLIALGWPPTNSDEATMGIMAMHIAYQGQHPAIFYGQNYMGTIEAYLGAGLFYVFGTSLFALRLGVVLLVTLFLVALYLLTSTLYTKKLALLTLVLLSIGSTPYLTRQTLATGGSSQTLLFGTLAFLIASWLALSPAFPPKRRWLRLLGYACWGLIAGLGIWSDLIILPFLLMSGLLLLLFCWREWRSLAPFLLIACLLIGVSPFIYHNLMLLRYNRSSLSVLVDLLHENAGGIAPTTFPQYLHAIQNTILISIPTATGNPFCPVLELSWLGDTSQDSLQCTIVHTTWGVGYLVLWTLAFATTAVTLWPLLARLRKHLRADNAERQTLIRYTARLLLLLSAALAMLLYAFSSAPVAWPGFHARYLIGLLIVASAVLSPLVVGIESIKLPVENSAKVRVLASRAIVLVVGTAFLIGTIITFSEVPATQAATHKQQLIAAYLVRIGVKHMYTDYWTCDRIVFQSNEKIVCDVVDDEMRSGYNRYDPYHFAVRGDPDSSYVFPLDTTEARALAKNSALLPANKHYRRIVYDDYVIYQPI